MTMRFKEWMAHVTALGTLVRLTTALLIGPAFFLLLCVLPIANQGTRIGFLLSGILTVASIAFVTRKVRWLATTLKLFIGAAMLFLVMPSRLPSDRMAIQERTIQALVSYTDRPYVWGGEGWLGMDCSGLVRRGMVDALLWEGIRQVNSQLFREGISLWWHDTTARNI